MRQINVCHPPQSFLAGNVMSDDCLFAPRCARQQSSLVPQRLYRIETRRATRRNEAKDDADKCRERKGKENYRRVDDEGHTLAAVDVGASCVFVYQTSHVQSSAGIPRSVMMKRQ